jgi:ketosteroid isomerase-like protein
MKSYPSPAEIVEQVYSAFARRELPRIFEAFAESVEILQSPELPWGGFYRGHDDAREFFSSLTKAISSSVTIEQMIKAGDRVVALGRTRGKVHATGASFDAPFAHVWTVRGGLVIRAEFYVDHPTIERALEPNASEAVSFEPSSDSPRSPVAASIS